MDDESNSAASELADAREALHLANGCADLAMQHRDAAEAELAAARETIKRLNRRVQVAEAAVAERVKASRGGMGRGLANAAAEMYKRERDEALAELAAVRKRIADAPIARLSVHENEYGATELITILPDECLADCLAERQVRLLVDDELP